jgi:hypothetical protein
MTVEALDNVWDAIEDDPAAARQFDFLAAAERPKIPVFPCPARRRLR